MTNLTFSNVVCKGQPSICPRPFYNPYVGGFGYFGGWGHHHHGHGGGYSGGYSGGYGGGYYGRGRGGHHGRKSRAAPLSALNATSVADANKKFFVGAFSYTGGDGFGYAIFRQPTICLTNGQEFSDLQAARCAIARDRSNTVGVRCLGRCSLCKTKPQCPVTQLPDTQVTVTPPTVGPPADFTLPPVIGQTNPPSVPVLPPFGPPVVAPPPLPDFLSAVHKIFE